MPYLNVTSQYRNEIQSKYFSIILVIFSSTWLISIISSVKIVHFLGVTLTGGFIIFPLTAALNSLIVDVYGYKGARQAIWCGAIVNLTYVVFINIVNFIPASPDWALENEFRAILVPQTRLIIASIIAFLFSGFLNSYLMAQFKNSGKSLLLRILFSSIIAITIDLLIYFFIGFLGVIPLNLLKKVFFFAYLKKIMFEILLLPFIWKLIDLIKNMEGFEAYDINTNFTPFSISNVYDFNAYKEIKKN
jgi:queuosine precursor transporter